MTEETKTQPRQDYKAIAHSTLQLMLHSEKLDFHKRYNALKALEIILNEWAELRNMSDDLSAPLERPKVNE